MYLTNFDYKLCPKFRIFRACAALLIGTASEYFHLYFGFTSKNFTKFGKKYQIFRRHMRAVTFLFLVIAEKCQKQLLFRMIIFIYV